MSIKDWYPRTYAVSPLPPPVEEANRQRHTRQTALDYAVHADLVAALSEIGRLAPGQARDGRREWAARERRQVRSTLGEVPALAISGAELVPPVQREPGGYVRRYTLSAGGASIRLTEVGRSVGAAPGTAVLLLPELDVTLGLARPAAPERWWPLLPGSADDEGDAAVVAIAAELPCQAKAGTAWAKRLLVSGSTFLGQLLGEVSAVAGWLRREQGFASVVVAGEGDGALAALLAAALAPDVSGCLVSRLPPLTLWPTDAMLLLPWSRRRLTVGTLAALLPPRGLLLLDESAPDDMVRLAQWSAGLAGTGAAPVQACSPTDRQAVAAWLEAVRRQPAEERPELAEAVPFPAVADAGRMLSPRQRYVTAIGGFPPPSEIVSWGDPVADERYRMEEVFYYSEPDVVVPGIFAAPRGASGPLPVVLVLPGSSATARDVAIAWGGPFLEEGMAVLAVDVKASRFGKRGTPAAAEAIARGTSALAQMTWDLMCAIDYLEMRPDVDAERIGCFGISIGGTQTWMLAAADDRVKVAAPVVGVASYESIIRCIRDERIDSSYMSCLDSHSIYYYPPGLLQVGDQKHFVALIAPRPLAILATNRDNCFPEEGVLDTYEFVRRRYRELGAEDRLDLLIDEGPHAYPPLLRARVKEWICRWI